MNMMQRSKTFTTLASISLLPLIFALLLALYHHFNWASYTGIEMGFALINAYIYAHSYAAILLALFAGMQIGLVLSNEQQPGYILFNFTLMGMAWLSYQSYADFKGIAFLMFCWLVALALDWHAWQTKTVPGWFAQLKLKLGIAVLVILGTLLLVNG